MSDLKKELFEYLKTEVEKSLAQVREITSSDQTFKFWCRDREALKAFAQHQAGLSAAIVDIVQKQLLDYNLTLMSAFDGATSLADDGRELFIAGENGKPLSETLHSEFMDFLAGHNL
jgi:hypothetical protein